MSARNNHSPEHLQEALRSAWFPVARVADIHVPQAVTLLGEQLVAFRGENGTAAVTSRRCPHRGGDLANGRVVGDAIECPYHGWRYDGSDGRCTLIPALGESAAIPANAKVATFPVEERYGLVWTSLGGGAVPCPELEELSELELSFRAAEPVDVAAGLLNSLENFRDVAHFPFVHRASMGEVKPQIEHLEVRSDGYHTWMTRNYSAQAGAAPVYRDARLRFNYHAITPSLASVLLEDPEGGRRLVMECFCPPGPTGCRIFLVSAVTLDYRGATADEALEQELQVLMEDKPILDSLIPPEVPLDGTYPQVSIAADRYTMTTRQAFLKFVEDSLRGDEVGAAPVGAGEA